MVRLLWCNIVYRFLTIGPIQQAQYTSRTFSRTYCIDKLADTILKDIAHNEHAPLDIYYALRE